jgi:hypothetical protein
MRWPFLPVRGPDCNPSRARVPGFLGNPAQLVSDLQWQGRAGKGGTGIISGTFPSRDSGPTAPQRTAHARCFTPADYHRVVEALAFFFFFFLMEATSNSCLIGPNGNVAMAVPPLSLITPKGNGICCTIRTRGPARKSTAKPSSSCFYQDIFHL